MGGQEAVIPAHVNQTIADLTAMRDAINSTIDSLGVVFLREIESKREPAASPAEFSVTGEIRRIVAEEKPRTAIEIANRIEELHGPQNRVAISTAISVMVSSGKLRKRDDLTVIPGAGK